MRYKQRRRLYSQNFLRDPKLINKLIRLTSIGKKDIVLEIGSGRGIITNELVKFAGQVIAIELDEKLYFYLRKRFENIKNLMLFHENFLDFKLPPYSYKVFANIPFIVTSDIVRKLTSDENLQEGYLIIQKEAAKKFIGKPLDYRNQMLSVLLKPWFNIIIFWEFNKSDFIPKPDVDCVMIKIKKREAPLLGWDCFHNYRDFILCIYNRERGVSKLETSQLIERFKKFEIQADISSKLLVKQKASKVLSERGQLQKIHRTRVDKNWRNYHQ